MSSNALCCFLFLLPNCFEKLTQVALQKSHHNMSIVMGNHINHEIAEVKLMVYNF